MISVSLERGTTGGLLRDRSDVRFVGLAMVHGSMLVCWPTVWGIAIGLWWNANTISHNFIHRPFFRRRRWNAVFSALLTLLLGVPQRLWRDRHLAHHAGRRWPQESRRRWPGQLLTETLLLVAVWGSLAFIAPGFLAGVYGPGIVCGLLLCQLHGYYEHRGGRTTACYGPVYNFLFFNDGYHVEHHRQPGTRWDRLADGRRDGAASRWPPVFRWLDDLTELGAVCVSGSLDRLERLALLLTPVQRWLLRVHGPALSRALNGVSADARVGVIGGGLFPRSVLLVEQVLPAARVTIIEGNPRHLERAVARLGPGVTGLAERYSREAHSDFDVLIVPLAFRGDRNAFYEDPPVPRVLVHDWSWRQRGDDGLGISFWLLKRLNWVTR